MESSSARRLEFAHPLVKEVMYRVDRVHPIRMLEVVRAKETHQEYIERGTTRISYEETWHNPDKPGNENGVLAGDVVPLPFVAADWKVHDKFYVLRGIIEAEVYHVNQDPDKNISFIWGGDWNNNGVFSNDPEQNWFDLPHYQFTIL